MERIISRAPNKKYSVEWNRIFGKIDHKDMRGLEPYIKKHMKPKPKDPEPEVMDRETGKPFTARAKNRLYGEFKHLKEKMSGDLCSKDECWYPTDRNIQKMQDNEMSKRAQARFSRMAAISMALKMDPKDADTMRLRRGYR